jgi:hypothetical protein
VLWRLPALLAATLVSLSGCSGPYPPVALASLDDGIVIAAKFCDPTLGFSGVTVRMDGDEEQSKLRVVWSAQLRPGALALDTVPLSREVEGYDVHVTSEWPLKPSTRYLLTDGQDQFGGLVLPSLLPFTTQSFADGTVHSADGGDLSYEEWSGAGGPDCHDSPGANFERTTNSHRGARQR